MKGVNIFFRKLKYNQYGRIVAAALRCGSRIYIGKNHAECFRLETMGTLRGAEQGFLTETGVFIDRKLALKIAKHYKQIKFKHPPEDELFSEDLID